MAFIVGTDSFNAKKLGAEGSAVIGSVRHIFYTDDTAITKFNVIDPSSTWNKIHFVEEFVATDNTNKVEVFDGKSLAETLEGKTSSELKITQIYRGWLNSIGKLKGKQLWFAEAYTDDRDSVNADGTIKFYEIRYVQGKLTSISEEKGDAEAVQKIVGEGSYTVATQRKIFRGITPVNVSGAVSGSTTITSGATSRTVTITGTDFTATAVTLTNLSVATLMGEVTGTSVKFVSASNGAYIDSQSFTNNVVTVNFKGAVATNTITIRAVVTTANGGSFESSDIVITL